MIRAIYNYFDFIQALSKQFNRNWVYFMFYSRTNISFIFTGTGSRVWPIDNQIVITNFFLDAIIIYTVIEYIIYYLYKHSEPFSGFESTTVRAIRKYNCKEDNCWNLISAYTISLQVCGGSGWLGIDFATIQNFCSTPSEEDRVDRRIFTPHL